MVTQQHADQLGGVEAIALARRLRRLTAMDAESMMTLTMPWAVSQRCSQKPSRPAS
jgi:hypothetical protein